MSDVFSAEMKRAYYNELLLQAAARQVDLELLEELKASRALPIDEAWLQNVSRSAKKVLRHRSARCRIRAVLRRLGQNAAVTVLLAGLLVGWVYDTVNAAHGPLGGILHGSQAAGTGAVQGLLPDVWDCPVCPTWVPDGYRLDTSVIHYGSGWRLVYTSGTDSIRFSIQSRQHPESDPACPSRVSVSETVIQGVPAYILRDPTAGTNILSMCKNDFLVEITAKLSACDLIQMAEALAF